MSRLVDLRKEFDNFGSATRTVCSRWSRGIYRTSRPCVVVSRGQSVRSLGMTQTLLTDAEVDQLVAAHEAGAALRGLAKQFHIHRLTAAADLARRGIPVRRAALNSAQTKEAARMYQARSTIMQVGRRFEMDAQTVRRAVALVKGWRSDQVDDHVGMKRTAAQQPDLVGSHRRSVGRTYWAIICSRMTARTRRNRLTGPLRTNLRAFHMPHSMIMCNHLGSPRSIRIVHTLAMAK